MTIPNIMAGVVILMGVVVLFLIVTDGKHDDITWSGDE